MADADRALYADWLAGRDRLADRAPERVAVPASDVCPECGGRLQRARAGEAVCGGCGLIADAGADADDDAPPAAPRLRIFGPGAAQMQADLGRTAATPAQRRQQIADEYWTCVSQPAGAIFPAAAVAAAIPDAAALFDTVVGSGIWRGQNKQAILAACFYRACLGAGHAPRPCDVAALLHLHVRGIARGLNIVRRCLARLRDAPREPDPVPPTIATRFDHLGMGGPEYAGLRAAALGVVRTAVRDHIGTSSVLGSKAAGAAFVVLRRCRDPALVPAPPTIDAFCAGAVLPGRAAPPAGVVLRGTVDRFVKEVNACHSHFAAVYRAHGLNDAPGV